MQAGGGVDVLADAFVLRAQAFALGPALAARNEEIDAIRRAFGAILDDVLAEDRSGANVQL